jgi:hypothetical protein
VIQLDTNRNIFQGLMLWLFLILSKKVAIIVTFSIQITVFKADIKTWS